MRLSGGRKLDFAFLRLRRLRDLSNVTYIAHHGDSGRVVVDVEPELKRRLYASLSLSGSTLKDWFMKVASQYCEEQQQPSFLKQVRYGPSRRSKALVYGRNLSRRNQQPRRR